MSLEAMKPVSTPVAIELFHKNCSRHDKCPLNEFCSSEARTECLDETLKSCQHCSVSIVYGLSFVYLVMGITIFVGNVIVISVYLFRYYKKIVSKSDPIRFSLAVVDLITSVQIFLIVMPDLLQSTRYTARYQMELFHDHSSAWKCGIFVVLCFSASLFHLILFGIQRLFAITSPMRYRRQTLKSVYIALAIVWIASIFTASIPGILPQYYRYCRRSNLCFICSHSLRAYVTLYLVFLFIPFLAMTIISIATAIVAHKKLSSSNMIRQASTVSQNARRTFEMQQVSAFKTVAFMQVGFSLSVGPSLVGVLLSTFGLDCRDLDLYETVCFVLFFSNSIVNVIVYGVRDEKFRETVLRMFRILKITRCFTRSQQQRQLLISRNTLHPHSLVAKNSLSIKLSINSIQRNASSISPKKQKAEYNETTSRL